MLSKTESNLFRYFAKYKCITRTSCYALAMFIIIGAAASLDSALFAQGTTSGGFKGVVRDKATGNPLPGAKVVLRNRQFGNQVTVIADDKGSYSQTSLPPGDYDIEVTAAGYVPQTKVQTLYAMANYAVEPDPFDMVTEQAAVVTTPGVTPEPGEPAPVPAPATGAQENRGGGEKIALDARRVGIFGRTSVNGLPLGNSTLTRTFDELAFLIPGVNPPPQAIGNTTGPGVGGGVGTSGQFSVNGLRSRANNFTVDGSDNNDEDIGVRRQGFFSLVPQPIESIQEFQVTTLLAPAEFGRSLGAQVNALSKSGGNRFHGAFYGMVNSDELNARNFFDNDSGNTTTNLTSDGTSSGIPVFVDGGQKRVTNSAGDKDTFTLVQGGFSIGGPIVRNKFFFFISGEEQELNGTKERSFAVPTVAQRGLFGSGATGLMTNGGTPVFPTSVGGDYVFSLFPFANDPTGVYGGNTFTQPLSIDARGRIYSGRIDWNIFKINGNQQTLTARYNYTNDRRDLTDVGGALFSAIRPKVRTDNISTFFNGSLTQNVSNEFRFSYGRTRLNFDEIRDDTGFLLPVTGRGDNRFLLNARVVENDTLPGVLILNCVAQSACYNTVPGFTTAQSDLGLIGQLVVAGFSPVGVDVFNFPQSRENVTYQFADTVRWQIQRHAVAFGADIRRITLDSDLPRNSRPLVTFNGSRNTTTSLGLANPLDLAASGGATGFFQSLILPGQNSRIKLNYDQYNLFAQNEWRINRKVMVSFGVRYEYNTVPKEADNKIENALKQPLPTRVAALSQFINGRTKIYDPDNNNFAARLGVAAEIYDKTVLRAGFGMYYDQILGAVVSQSRNVFPTFTTINFGGGNQCVDAQVNFVSCFDPSAVLLGFSLFNPLNGNIGGTPIIQPGTLNTLNSAFVSGGAPSNSFLDIIFANFPSSGGTPFGGTYPKRTLNTPNSFQYSVSVEREIARNTFLSVAFVGTEGRDLLRFTTPNAGSNFVATVNGFFGINNQPLVVGSTRDPVRPVPAIGPISQFETTGTSRYDSAQIELRGRLLRNRFQYRVNYVYGKVIDDVSDVFDLAGASALPQNSTNFTGESAPANFDVRHRFTYNLIFDSPELTDRGNFVRYLFGNWQISTIGKFNTGQPFTINSIYDINQDGNLTDRLNNTQFITETGDRRQPLRLTCSSPTQCATMLAGFGQDGAVQRNTFRAGSILDMDVSFSKRFPITESQNLQFRADIFNFIDRDNFGIPVRYLEAPGFGRATDTVTPGRRIQLGLKYTF